jgi:hypothetical protein
LANFTHRFDDTILAATSPTRGQIWSSLGAGWNGFSSAEVVISQDETRVTLNVVDTNQERMTASITLPDDRVTVLGRADDVVVLRLEGASSAFALRPV